MEKINLQTILSEMLKPIGFKKKGNYWILNSDKITKMVNLQQSQFSNRFYINYGYIINSIPLGNLKMHIFRGLGSTDLNANEEIKNLLNLEHNISDEKRAKGLEQVIFDHLIYEIQLINTEDDILRDLKSRPDLNDVPGVVRKYFNLL